MYKYFDSKGQHLHTLDSKPLIGTSSVSDVLAKPLTWWASGLAVMQLGIPDSSVLTKIKNEVATEEEEKTCMTSVARRLEEIKLMTPEEYFHVLDGAYRAHATTLKKKAKEGTDLHAELEKYVKNHMVCRGNAVDTTLYDPKIQPFITWTEENVDEFLWSEAHCYSEEMWTGGISDVGARLKDGKTVIIDFKSSKEAYMSQFWQCVGYAMQIEENGWYDRDGIQLGKLEQPIDYVCVVPFGAPKVEPQFFYDIQGGKEAFLAEVYLYKKLN